MKRRRTVFKVAALTIALTFATLAAEVAARIARPGTLNQAEPENLEDKAGEGWDHRPRPGSRRSFGGVEVRINAHGFRDQEDWPLEKPAGERRILFVGDSFLYAAFLREEEVVFKRMQALLGKGARAIALACPGWGTNHQRVALERFGLAARPDVVVVCFFVGNDVLESVTLDPYFVDPDFSLRHEKRVQSLRKRLLAHSKLWQIISATETYQRIAHPHQFEKANAKDGRTLKEDQYWRIQFLRLQQWRRGAWERPPVSEGWALVEEHLGGLVAGCRVAGAKVVVLAIPDETQVDAVKRAELCKRFDVDEKDYELEQPQRRLGELAAKLGVPLVDPLPALRAQGSSGGLYFDLDTHWNAKAHALAAEQLAPVVRRALGD